MTDFSDIHIKGLFDGDSITSGERLAASGHVSWSNHPDHVSFIVDKDDPRYVACLETAHELAKEYPRGHLTGDALAEREKTITAKLTEKIHEQFGEINMAVQENSDAGKPPLPSEHNDIKRALADPAHLSEFKSGELVCRHYAPVTSMLMTEAGVPNFLMTGYTDGPHRATDNGMSRGDGGWHGYVASRDTGNVIDGVYSGDKAYRKSLNHPSLTDMLAGETIVAFNATEPTPIFSAYSQGSDGSEAFTQAIAARKKMIEEGHFESLPSVTRGQDNHIYTDRIQDYDVKTIVLDSKALERTNSIIEKLGGANIKAGETNASLPSLQQDPAKIINH